MHTTPHRSPSSSRRGPAPLPALLLVLLLLVAACGGSDDTADDTAETTEAAADAAPTADATTAESAAPAPGDALAITAVDYAYEGVPSEIGVGTELTLTGAPDAEPHELVAFALEEGDERPAMEILAASGPDGPPPGEFAGVLVAPPGGAPGFAPAGPVVLDEPGRYLFVCFVPTGTTAEAFGELGPDDTTEDLPPSGPPHFVQGMLADVTVTG